MALGDSYVAGMWDVVEGRVCDFLGVLLINGMEKSVELSVGNKVKLFGRRLLRWRPPRRLTRLFVASHYDLGEDFFGLFLDPSLTYSCGYRKRKGESLAELQENKYQRVCRKLGMRSGGTLLDVGCGWGGLLRYAGLRYPELRGLGITLSRRQTDYAQVSLAQAGLTGRLTVEYRDYREVSGCFDYIASIGMFEHVGHSCYQTFMDRMRAHLAQGGVGLLHTMGVSGEDGTIDPWLEARIFPGAEVPRLEEIARTMRQAGLRVAHVENLAPHYAETLERWTDNLAENRAKVLALGRDERFYRAQHFYLQLCEAGFRYGMMELYQVLFAHEGQWPFADTLDFGSGALSEA